MADFSIRDQAFTAPSLEPGLYCVATPIGNLGDITIRALEVLASCDLIACEDTRTSGVLFQRYGIDRPKISYNEHNAETRGPDLLRQIAEGAAVALVSDAGTPLVSDPGMRLVGEAIDRQLPVIPLPGASAPLAALVGSGLDAGAFRFHGFLPAKSGARGRKLRELADAQETLIFFESPARLSRTLADARDILGDDRRAVIARELTKLHETFHRGTLAELAEQIDAMDRVRGEIVLLVEGSAGERTLSDAAVDALLLEALKTSKTKDAARAVAERSGRSIQDLYARALALKAADDTQ